MRTILIILLLITSAFVFTPTATAADLSDDDSLFVSMDYMEIARHAYQYGYRNSAPNAYSDGYNHTIAFGSSMSQTNTSMFATDGNTTTAWTLTGISQVIHAGLCSTMPHTLGANKAVNITIADHYQQHNNLSFNTTTIELDFKLEQSGTVRSCAYAIGYLGGTQVGTAYSDACTTVHTRCLVWLNFSSEVRLDQIAFFFGGTSCSSSCSGASTTTTKIFELSVYSDDDGYSPIQYSYANSFASYGKVVRLSDTRTGFGSENFTLGPGAYSAIIYHSFMNTTSLPTTQNDTAYDWGIEVVCHSISCTNQSVNFITPHRNVSTGGTCMAAYITFYNPSAQELNFSYTDAVNNSDVGCSLTEGNAANLPTPYRADSDYKIMMDYGEGYDINGNALGADYDHAVVGYLLTPNQFPFVSALSEDMQWINGGGLDIDNVSIGARTFSASPSVGDTFIVSLPSSTPYQFFGNGIFLGLGQDEPTDAEPSDWEVLINDVPATYVTSFSSADVSGALFYIDDTARRNGANILSNGTEFTSNYRPLGTESYYVELAGDGWDSSVALKNLMFIGYEGHKYLACAELCWSYYETEANLPTTQDNAVRFYVINSGGSPVTDARVTLNLNATSLYVPSHGQVNWTTIFQTAQFTISKAGYQSVCAKFYFISSGPASTGVDGGCKYIRGYNASFTIVLLTNDEAGTSSNGTLTINNSVTDEVTIDPNPGNFTVPEAANFTVDDVNSTLYFAIFKQANNGNIVLITSVSQLIQNNYGLYNVTWPTRGYTTNTSTLNQVGSYVLAITDNTGSLQASAPFIIRDDDTTPSYIDTNNSLVLGSIIGQIIPQVQQAQSQTNTAESRTFVEDATEFAFDDPFVIPNMWLFLIIMLIVAIALRRAERSE